MDKCRELFEKFPCSAVPDQYKRVDGKYVYHAIQRDWEEFIRGWNASHDSCMDICSDMTESDTISGCVRAIERDKVKL